ncbi:hypothetical protein [Hydrogenophaga sp. PAMC20947]|uniref:hypothetical protein n=1 Tax=Hydrogenophaga sp. PAMC20947 TaxID=2565558 RepID=UPI00109E1FD1|nr:hypothetical protein [Hydrogenophaga sp. PAMC20947]QCB47452.1 hypothetical protein E5678_16345 [Hydrogenophaga sp. PAMC20947]
MRMTSQDYADLAIDSYRSRSPTRGDDTETIGEHQYKVLYHQDNPKTGYQGTIYQRVDTREIIVAHRGTEFDREALKDGVLADGGMVLNRSNLQVPDAIGLTRKAMQLAQDQAVGDQTPPVTVTGHSLGGTLAQVSAHYFGLKGETINAYGAASLNLRIPAGGNDVTNHVMAGDLVSAGGAHYGQVKVYATPQEIQTLRANGYHNTTHWSDALRGYGPVQLATGFTPPTTTRAAFAMSDSHKGHHFANVDANGRPDHSVLEDPAASRLARANAVAIGEYRGDVQDMRGAITAVSRGASAVAHGTTGLAQEIIQGLKRPLQPGERWQQELEARHAGPGSNGGPIHVAPTQAPLKAGAVPAASIGPRASLELSPVSKSLLGDSERQVRQLASTHNLPWDRGLDNTVCSLARCAREQGMTGINLLRVNSEGQIRYGQHDGITLKDGTLDARQAANTPAADSLSRLVQLDQPAQQHNLQASASVHEPLIRAM